MAAAVISELLEKSGVSEGWTAASAGLHCGCGARASIEAAIAASEIGLDLSGHKSRPMTDNLASSATHILAMTSSLAQELKFRFPFAAAKVTTLGAFSGRRNGTEISDPFGGSVKQYRSCLSAIALCAGNFVKTLDENSRR